jgi:capsule polysaccharide export protein KpsE/RkpR
MTAPPSNLPPRILRLLGWKRWVIINTVVVAACAVVVSLLLPKWYLSTTTIFPPEREGGVASLLGGEGEGNRLSMSLMASLLGGGAYDMPLFATPSDIMARILRSRTLGERLIRGHDLLSHFKVKNMDDALEILNARMDVRVGREGLVTLGFLEIDPQLAADLANDAVRTMDEIQRERRHSAASTARKFTARRLAETRLRLAAAEDSLRQFQQETGIVAPESQTESLVEAVAELTGRRIALEVQRETLLEIAGPEHPRIERFDADIRILDEALEKLGVGRAEVTDARPEESEGVPLPVDGGRSPGSLASLSDLMLEYQRLLREVKIQETLHEYLITRHEYYRIEEVRDTPTVQVLDEARPAERKVKPIRWLICVVSTILGFAVSVLFFQELERLRESAVAGGTYSQIVERLGGSFLVRRLRRVASAQS